MDTSNGTNQTPIPSPSQTSTDNLTITEIESVKSGTIAIATEFAKNGKKTHKDIADTNPDGLTSYDWWENQGTFESNIWSVAYWKYSNEKWQIQATKVELQPDGHTKMTSYSIRDDKDLNFPGFQIYAESKDELYHPVQVEDIVYLNRVITGLLAA